MYDWQDGTVHSRVAAFQGFSPAFLPARRLQTKLNKKINWAALRTKAK